MFKPLQDLDLFKKVALDDCHLSICWPNGADICPDVLYEMGTDISSPLSISVGESPTLSKNPAESYRDS